MAEGIRVAAFIHAERGQEAAVKAALLACVEPTRAEEGNSLYVLHNDEQDPLLFVFIEHWASKQALEQHMQTPHFKKLQADTQGKLAQPPIVHVLNPV